MKIRYLIPLVVVGLVGCEPPEPKNLDSLVRLGNQYLDRETMSPYSGPVFSLVEGDSTKMEERGTLNEGFWDGLHESY